MNAIPGKPEVEAVEPIPAKVYISKEWAQAEKERLWTRVWQMACREEEIPSAGDFYTYEILDESISVVRRADGTIGAYYNVCPHRGRRLTEGCGKMGKFHCRFHGWQFDLHGKPVEVVDRQDWGDTLKDEEITLQSVQVATWGGWVFINMDPKAESFEEFLGPAKPILDPFDFGKMRFEWRKQIKLECNWKIILEAFNEGYHVQTTHKQLVPLYNDLTYSKAVGKHGMFGATEDGLFGLPSPRLGPVQGDLRKGLAAFNYEIYSTLRALSTEPMIRAGQRLVEELPETATPMEVFGAFSQFHKEESEKIGLPWPEMSPEQIMAAGTDWHIFPNMIFLPTPTNVLCYRSRPATSNDPDQCIFEVYVLQRFADGKEPTVEVEYAAGWRDVDWGLILGQDFENVEEIQKGLKSKGFKGARPNPHQEMASINFHRVLREYVEGA